MKGILTILSVQDGRIKRSALEALTRARTLACETGAACQAAILHSAAPDLAATAMEYGATTVFAVQDPIFDSHLNTPVLSGLQQVITKANPRLVVFASTEAVKDVLGALAVRMDAAVLPDVASFDVAGNTVQCSRPVMAAKMLADVSSDHERVFVSVRSGSYEATTALVDGSVESLPFALQAGDLKQTLKEVISTAGDTVDLSEARVVVAAGRGVRDEEGKALIEELADVMGAAIGASRAVVENGLFPATAQIGQTGKVVSPDLYFAIGISGAIQHVAGMSNSRVIVAVNRDADAPIFKLATYGLVGDLYKILPPLIEGLRNAG